MTFSGDKNPNFLHGLTGTKVYSCWLQIKKRCLNENDVSYCWYGAKGVKISENYVSDFKAFFEEVGNPPDEFQKWSIDRIDCNLGYVKGNMIWSTPDKQARNRTRRIDCTSGYTAVRFEHSGKSEHTTYVVASWVELSGERKRKTFNVKKLGLLEAFALALDFRYRQIERLNEQGAGYSLNHGKRRNNET